MEKYNRLIVEELNNTAQRMFTLASRIESGGNDNLTLADKKMIRLSLTNWLDSIQKEQALFFIAGQNEDFKMSIDHLLELSEILD